MLDTDASAVAISGILHQWQGPPGERRLHPILHGSKKLTATKAKYGAPKLEMYAAFHFIVKNHSYLCPRKFTLRVDNQALSWLKTYSTDQALIGRWIMTLDKYHFRVEHRPRTQHRNADGLSKRTNDYRRTTYDLANTDGTTMQNVPSFLRQAALAVRSVSTELHEHTHTVHVIKYLLLAQNREVHVLALKKLVNGENIDQDIFPEDVRAFARNYFRQKKELLFVNPNGVPCVKYPPAQPPLHERPCMIVMPQLYQHEILFRAHDAMGHQGIGKVVARIQERHTWPGIRRTVGEYVSQCLTCQQVRDKPGDVRFHLKNIQSGYFNELVQYDHMKLCPTDDGNTGVLVIIDHFSKFAEAVPCRRPHGTPP